MAKREYKIVPLNNMPDAEGVSSGAGWLGSRRGFIVKVREQPGGVGTEPMWFDAGDPCDTHVEAERKVSEYLRADRESEQP